jgi:hypothetical protein
MTARTDFVYGFCNKKNYGRLNMDRDVEREQVRRIKKGIIVSNIRYAEL